MNFRTHGTNAVERSATCMLDHFPGERYSRYCKPSAASPDMALDRPAALNGALRRLAHPDFGLLWFSILPYNNKTGLGRYDGAKCGGSR